MTAQELRDAWLVGYDAKANFTASGYEDGEISFFLTKAELTVVQGYLRAKKYDEILELIRTEKFMLTTCTIETLGECAYQTTIPTNDNFLEHIRSRVFVKSRTEVVVINGRWVECKQITQKEVQNFIQTVTNQPLLINPKVLLSLQLPGVKIIPVLLYDKYTTIDTAPVPNIFEFTYAKMPHGIDITNGITSELAPNLHQLIVNIAVADAIATSDVSRVQQPQQQGQNDNSQQQTDE